MILLCRRQKLLFTYYSSTVYALFMHLKILKMGPTVLFTHLKIILLQCFQFSVSATISSIQTDPRYIVLWCFHHRRVAMLWWASHAIMCYVEHVIWKIHLMVFVWLDVCVGRCPFDVFYWVFQLSFPLICILWKGSVYIFLCCLSFPLLIKLFILKNTNIYKFY